MELLRGTCPYLTGIPKQGLAEGLFTSGLNMFMAGDHECL